MSRKQKHKAHGRVTTKMSRDGLIERNEATGEDFRVSKRDVELDLRGGKQENETFLQNEKRGSAFRGPDGGQSKKHKNRRPAERNIESEKNAPTDVQARPADNTAGASIQPETPLGVQHTQTGAQSETSAHEAVRREKAPQPADVTPASQRHTPLQQPPPIRAKPPPVISETRAPIEETPQSQSGPRSALNHDDSGKLRFKDGETAPPQNPQQRQKTPRFDKTGETEPITSGQAERMTGDAAVNRPIADGNNADTTPPLKHDNPDRLHFKHDNTDTRPLRNPNKKPVPNREPEPVTDANPNNAPFTEQWQEAPDCPDEPLRQPENDQSALRHDKTEQPLKTDKPGRLRFEPNSIVAPPPVKPKHNPVIKQETEPVTNENQSGAAAEQRQETPESSAPAPQPENGQSPLKHDDGETPLQTEPDATLREDKADTPLHEDRTDAPLKPDNPGKLRFAEDETAPTPPTRGDIKSKRKLGKAQKQADRAVTKLENAKGKLPVKKKLRSERVFNEETGKPKRRLYFESEVKSQGEHLKGALPLRPVKAAGNSALMYGHRKMYQVEHENVSVKAAHRAEMAAEGGVRAALRFHKTAPYRKVAKLEQAAQKKAINLTYQQTLAQNPKLKSNIISRALQKRKIKKDYAKAAREAQKAAKNVKKAGSAAGNAVKTVAGVIKRHPIASVVVILIALLLFCLMSLIGAFGGMGGGIAASTYIAEDSEMIAAETAYSGMETDLKNELDNYEALHPGYDEYVFHLDEIWHDPYVLMSILSSLHDGAWTADGVQATLAMLFERQYTLTETVTTETRYRSETDPTTGESTDVPYTHYKCTVTLENFNLSHLPIYIMDEDRLSRYALFTATLGNRPDLFPVAAYPHASVYKDYGHYDVPPEYLADETFAAMLTEAEKYLGMPYVWGGYSPKTSFDCSGFVSWVINHSGWNVGRLGAQGLYNISTPVSAADAKPGDLVFFHSTYNAPGITHVGIYVGDGMMVHAGDPIGFASIETAYFRQHFQGFGKLY